MTEAEKTFFNRMAFYIAQGMDFEAAGRAVLAADQKITAFVFDSKDGAKVQKALAAKVYHSIRECDATNKALNGF